MRFRRKASTSLEAKTLGLPARFHEIIHGTSLAKAVVLSNVLARRSVRAGGHEGSLSGYELAQLPRYIAVP